MEVYLEIEDVKCGRMIAELFENLSEGCLYELLNHKHGSLEQARIIGRVIGMDDPCLLYTSPSPRDGLLSRMPSSA